VKGLESGPAAAIIRDEQPGEAAAIRALHMRAFGATAEADLVDALRGSGFAELSLVAAEPGAIVGHLLLSRLGAPVRALALAPLSVSPARQGSGLGTALVRRALARAAERGWQAVFVLSNPVLLWPLRVQPDGGRRLRLRVCRAPFHGSCAPATGARRRPARLSRLAPQFST
jgi:predicted N-acetyltransferase YhbS